VARRERVSQGIDTWRTIAERFGRLRSISMDLEDVLLMLAVEAKEKGDDATVRLCERTLAVERLDRSVEPGPI
jgi:hypothetical protein